MSSSETAVFGHSNPDTDAIASAIVYATFLNRMGVKAKPYRLADVNNETTFVLHEANVEQPDFVGDLPDGTEVALVDHNESQQSVQNIKKLKITRVVDHHKLGDLTTSSPIFIRMEPVGCTGTILAKLFRENDLDIDKSTARLLVSSILSDTLHFRSTTTSDDDRKLLDYLTPIAEIKDVKDYALKMFEAKSDISNMSPDKILKLDYKIFPFDNEKWAIGVIETTNPKHALDRKQELLDEINKEKKESQLNGLLFSVIDILKETNLTFAVSDRENEILKEVFNADVKDNVADLGNRISRKKQIVPDLEAYLNERRAMHDK